MNPSTKILSIIAIGLVCICFMIYSSPLFKNSTSRWLNEDDLPTITIEDGLEVYCRMQADDFRFTLPSGGTPNTPQIISSSFDSIEGSLIVSFPSSAVSPDIYRRALRENIQTGGDVSVRQEVGSSNLIINFSYFGDR